MALIAAASSYGRGIRTGNATGCPLWAFVLSVSDMLWAMQTQWGAGGSGGAGPEHAAAAAAGRSATPGAGHPALQHRSRT